MVVLREGLCPGLDEDLLRDLRAADIKTVEDLVSSDIEELAQKCSVSYKALFAIRRVLLAQHTAFPVSGADLYEELLSSTAILSTGNPSLDKLLDSGLYTGEITELSGGPGSGKSQVCFRVAVHISYQLKQSVIYIDTTGGLTAGRLLQMLQAETSNTEEQMEALQRIHIFRLFDIFSLLDCLYGLCSGGLQQASVGGGSAKAVIVDSVSAVISPLLGGKQYEGNKPCNEKWQRGGAARPWCVLESHPQNQSPAGASREGRGCQPLQFALCNTDQVFQTVPLELH
ncbi:DNA repair protein RAD51 homolog 4 isoform X4 [Xiphias gladius]|uniref:DNA repair protein RAD51 homolog 4 isoform X4 n=1 Tax=Xiphias gladius TaxID=8245 RepID=UPI001A97F7A3|nr:DNA repair protein RAD51 homolog 4 isoform X4 [Xiphias gladius]